MELTNITTRFDLSISNDAIECERCGKEEHLNVNELTFGDPDECAPEDTEFKDLCYDCYEYYSNIVG